MRTEHTFWKSRHCVCAWALGATLYLGTLAWAQKPETIVGKWQIGDDKQKQIEVTRTSENLYEGKAINDDKSAGAVLFKNMKFNASKNRFEGSLKPPGAPFTVNATLRFDGVNRMRAVGKKLFVTKRFVFYRIIEAPAGASPR